MTPTERYEQARRAFEDVRADRSAHPEAVQSAWDAVCEAWPAMVEEQGHEMAFKRFAGDQDKR